MVKTKLPQNLNVVLQEFVGFRQDLGLRRMAGTNNIEEILKPFYQRASDAQDRLAKLEASITPKENSENVELIKTIDDLRSELKDARAEQAAEREKALKELQQQAADNARFKYRITHLVQTVKEIEANCSCASK